ncbi:MAG: hypothetical protein IJE68_00395 [Clostridia bacterium]|nr:hypothetical protein [Clostridia bacterium]
MSIFKKLWQKLKNIFIKKQEIVMLDISKCDLDEPREGFKESLKVTFEKISQKRKKVESHICYGDGLGIKRKLEY